MNTIITLAIIALIAWKLKEARKQLNTIRNTNEDDLRELCEFKEYANTFDKDEETEHDATDYITYAAVAKSHNISLKALSKTASNSVGLGIAGTFLGLTIGIWSLPSTWSAESISEIHNFLSSMGTAFWTSLAGMVGSLMYTYWESKTHHECEQTIASFCHNENLVHKRTSTYLLTKSLGATLKQNNDEQTTKLIKAYEETMRTELNSIVNALQSTTQNLNKAADDFNTASASIKDASTTLGSTISVLDDKLPELTNAVDSLKNGIGALGNTAKKMSEATEKQTETINELIKANSNIQDAINKLNNALEDVNNLPESIDKARDHIKELYDETEKLLSNYANNFTNACSTINNTTSEISQAMGVFNKNLTEHINEEETLIKKIEEIFKSIESSHKKQNANNL